jgi:signal peptidase I
MPKLLGCKMIFHNQVRCPSLFIGLILLCLCGCSNNRHVELQVISMEPNYSVGQIFTIEAIKPSELKRGDIVNYNSQGKQFLHRLIGLPNETVEIKDGKVFIDGKLLPEPYKVNPPSYDMKAIKLGENEYFVLGDNRDLTADSHFRGPIQGVDILGRAIPGYH